MWRKLSAIFRFYRGIIVLSFVIDICCLILFSKYGFSIFSGLFWLKLTTLGITVYWINEHKKKNYYFYYNMGLSKSLLWSATLSLDFAIFILLIIYSYKFR